MDTVQTVQNAWQTLCLPGKVYLVLALLGIASTLGAPRQSVPQKITTVAGNALWALVWVWFISMLCDAGWIKLAWVMSIGLPVLMIVVVVVLVILYAVEKGRKRR